jgi:multidrug transporter EmrE-like cation transporter
VTLPVLPPLLWLTLSGLFFAGGEYLSKRFILGPSWPIFILLMCMYCFGVLLWIPALMQQRDLSVAGTLWSVISLCMTVLIGIIIFHESLTGLRIVGILLAAASIVILSLA